MISNELFNLLDYMEREKGVKKEELMETIKGSIVLAAKRIIGRNKKVLVRIDEETGDIFVGAEYNVVKDSVDVSNEDDLINISEAKKFDPKIKEKELIVCPVSHRNFGRIAVKISKQAILDKLRRIEQEKSYERFKDQIGEIVNCVVKRFDRGNIIVEIQKNEGIILDKDRVRNEKYSYGDRINALLIDINTNSGFDPTLILSRFSNDFIRKLFEREITEIRDDIIIIDSIVREPGIRTKISVHSTDDKIDSVGSCIGMKGSRIKNIMSELNGEKIDVVRYDSDFIKYAHNVLQPAIIKDIKLNKEEKIADIYVVSDHVKLAIGKGWQNIKLCEKLLDVKINVLPFE